VPEDLPKSTKERIAQAIIDKIIEKSEDGLDRNGRSLPSYAKSYTESDAFEAFGKSKRPNMTLSGDLLGQIDVISTSGDKLKIGWKSELENAKAHGNITGQEGLWKKKRDFFGLTAKEIKEIIDGESED
jgi:hypothetical protein